MTNNSEIVTLPTENQKTAIELENFQKIGDSQSYYESIDKSELRYVTSASHPPIAKTNHSTVHKIYSKRFQRCLALKIVDRKSMPADVANKFLRRELDIIRTISQPNIVSYLDFYEPNESKVVIVSEFYENGSLLNYVNTNGPISEPVSARMFLQLISAIQYLHERGIVHRDIKLDNIFLDDHLVVKLGDFGLARLMPKLERSESFCGSWPYSAPEMVSKLPYDPYSVDWYAAGVVLFTMLMLRWPVISDTVPPRVENFFEEYPSMPAKELISRLIEREDHQRAGYQECVDSEWMFMHTAQENGIETNLII